MRGAPAGAAPQAHEGPWGLPLRLISMELTLPTPTHVCRVFPSPEEQARLWGALAQALGAARLARQAPVAETGTRDSRAVLLTPNCDGWVHHREGGVTFVLDITRCMYSRLAGLAEVCTAALQRPQAGLRAGISLKLHLTA